MVLFSLAFASTKMMEVHRIGNAINNASSQLLGIFVVSSAALVDEGGKYKTGTSKSRPDLNLKRTAPPRPATSAGGV